MRTIAQAYEENGIKKGIQIGEVRGKASRKVEIARKVITRRLAAYPLYRLL